MKHFRLNGESMPALGLGTYELTGVTCRNAVLKALELGYRHIDTARAYGNEHDIGAAVVESRVPREEIFLTTKIDREDLSPRGVDSDLEESLKSLRTDYVDLALIHWPNDDYTLEKTFEALEAHREKGRIRHVGVSNFTPTMVSRALECAPIRCNQVEYSPLLDQSALLEQARDRGLVLTAYSPLAQGKALEEETVRRIAGKIGRGPSQVVLRWHLQQERVAVIPRTSREDHLQENIAVFDFSLSEEQMRAVSRLARGERQIDPPWAPRWEG